MQVDTLSVALCLGRTVKHFTSVDRLSRLSGTKAFSNATVVRTIYVDGGSEFMDGFRDACRQVHRK